MTRLDWKKIWQKFEDWCDAECNKPCTQCGHKPFNVEWEDQQLKIQEIVNKELSSIGKS